MIALIQLIQPLGMPPGGPRVDRAGRVTISLDLLASGGLMAGSVKA